MADLHPAEVDAGGAQLVDERPVRLDREPAHDRAGDRRADAVGGGQAASLASRMASSEPNRRASASLADGPRPLMPSAVSSRGSGRSFEPAMRGEQLLGADLGEALEPEQLLGGERVDVGRIGDQPGVAELEHGALAEALDVHRPARREVDDPLVALERAGRLDAAGVGLALGAHQLGVQRARAVRREHPRLGAGRAQREHRPDDLGDDVAGLAHDHRVAGADVLDAHLVLVVQRGHAARCEPPTNTGSSTANGVVRPVRPTDTWMSRSTVVRSSGGNL